MSKDFRQINLVVHVKKEDNSEVAISVKMSSYDTIENIITRVGRKAPELIKSEKHKIMSYDKNVEYFCKDFVIDHFDPNERNKVSLIFY